MPTHRILHRLVGEGPFSKLVRREIVAALGRHVFLTSVMGAGSTSARATHTSTLYT